MKSVSADVTGWWYAAVACAFLASALVSMKFYGAAVMPAIVSVGFFVRDAVERLIQASRGK